MSCDIFTIGHSNRTLDVFLDLLKAHGIALLVDVRSMPRSRYNPHFNGDALKESLRVQGIGYLHLPELGGRRQAREDSVNTGFHPGGFRGYADYMQTPEFATGLQRLMEAAHQQRTAFMCAEALPENCHRSLLADALLVQGWHPCHILGPAPAKPHELTSFAETQGTMITYPAPSEAQATLAF